MELRPGYKQTEVGVIPEDWECQKLSEIIALPVQNGVFNEPARKGRGCKLINVSDLYASTPVDISSLELFDANKSEITRFGVQHGDMFFTRSSITPDGIAHCNIYDEHLKQDIVFDCHLIRVRMNKTKADPFFLFRFCTTAPARRYLVASAKSTTMTTIDQAVIACLPVLIPPLPEQRAIAAALSDVDALISGLDRLIAKKRDIKQAAMQQLLTGKQRLPGFSGEWEVDYIENIANITTGSKNTQDRIDDGAFPFFVRSQTVERINSYSFDGEAVLTAGDGVGTGKVFHYINGKFDAHQRVYRISDFVEKVNGYFFYLYFSNNFYNRIMQMTAKSSFDSVRREMIARMPIPLPPTREEQTAIAAILSDMDAEITTLEARLCKTRDLKLGMMQELLTGRIRLV